MNPEKTAQALLTAVLAAEGVAKRFAQKCNIRDPQFVDEVMQESYLRLLKGGCTGFVASQGSLRVYVSGVVYKVCIWALRTYFGSTELPLDVQGSTNVVAAVERNESIRRVVDTLNRLPAEDRELILTSTKCGAKKGEAASPCSPQYVRRHRAMQRFIIAFQQTTTKFAVA